MASILNATTPLFTIIVAHMFTSDERITGRHLVGASTGFVGVAVMIGAEGLLAPDLSVVAQLACLAGAISYACAGVFGRRFRAMGMAPLVTATGQVTASSLMLFPIKLLVDKPWTLATPGVATMLALVGVAALSTALAYVLYFRILATAGATNLLLVTFLIPVSAILLGVLIPGETLQPKHFIGMALLGLGLAAIDGRTWRAIRAASTSPSLGGMAGGRDLGEPR